MSATRVTVLSAPACELCEHAKAVLARLGDEYDLEVRELSTTTEQGRRLMTQHQVAFPPGVLLDGEAFSYGRLSERRMRRELERRGTPPRRAEAVTAVQPTDNTVGPVGDVRGASPYGTASGHTRPSRRRRRRRRTVVWSTLAALLVAAGVLTVLGLSPPATQVEAQSPLVGQPAPAITGPTITGQHFSLAGLQGHFVVVDFFSSWCVACRQEAPQLARFVAQQAGPSGARLVGVIFEDTVPAIRQFLGPELGRYPVVADPAGRIALDYGVDNPPEKYLVSPNGVVLLKVIGPVTASLLDQLIAKAKAADW